MTAYRKKPVVIEATQWFKHGDHPAVTAIPAEHPIDRNAIDPAVFGWVPTLEGGHVVTPGDWIITGVKGEHYPCKPDIFAATYDSALAASVAAPAAPASPSVAQAEPSERAASLVASEEMVRDSARWRLLRTWEHQASICDNTGITLTFRFDGIDGDGFEDDEPMWLDSVVDAARASAGESQATLSSTPKAEGEGKQS